MIKLIEPSRKIKFIFLIIPVLLLFLLFIGAAGIWSYNAIYANEVYPGVRIGGYNIGGLARSELRDLIENLNNRYAKEGIDLSLTDRQKIKLNTVASGESAVEMVRLDSEALSRLAFLIGREGDGWNKFILPIIYRFQPINLSVPVIMNKPVLVNNLKDSLVPYEDLIQDASIRNVDITARSAEIVPEKSGKIFDYDEAAEKIRANMARLSFEPVSLRSYSFNPTIVRSDIIAILPTLWPMLEAGAVRLATDAASSSEFFWDLPVTDLSRFVEVRRDTDTKLSFFLNRDRVEEYFKLNITPSVEVSAKDAKFITENNRVKEFEPSAVGKTIDMDETFENLNAHFRARGGTLSVVGASTGTVAVVLKTVLPRVQMSDSNDLGIVELVGVGTSTFKDSHTNRIKNIANAVARLNGALIKPGEVFSANKYAGPYTVLNGFLPEQIIKGRKIATEVGGGMCQIGTTLFRMAMQTGLSIAERHNHSLVVQYYADPVNGNPGTDATLYEPTLDLKFLNDTGHYLLLLTNIDYKKQMLTFSLWGTKDGRAGWYSHPIVSKWIPPPKEVEYLPWDGKTIVDKKSEAAKCQPAFRGAVASFTYSRITPTGEHIDRVFDSYYRPLPKICPATTTPSTNLTSVSQ